MRTYLQFNQVIERERKRKRKRKRERERERERIVYKYRQILVERSYS